MSQARYLVGDVFDRMAELEDGSIDLVLTSPPFLALRSYLPDDHPDKDKEIGGEPDPAAFLDTLLALTARWRQLLAPHGSIAVELGDTYAGSGSPGGDYGEGGMRDGQPRTSYSGRRAARKPNTGHHANRGENEGAPPDRLRTKRQLPGWPMDKSLCGIPHLYHLSLAYGINLLTGQPSPAGQWRIRNVVAWCRPNPPVGQLSDKVRPATSYITIATLARDRYFDLDAVRGAPVEPRVVRVGGASASRGISGGDSGNPDKERLSGNPAGAPPLDHWWHDDEFDQDAWHVSTQPYAGAHYATWPKALLELPIKAMVPHRVCTTCGEPSRRIVDSRRVDGDGNEVHGDWKANNYEPGKGYTGDQGANRLGTGGAIGTERTTLGWSDCGHDTWRHGIVLDPFAGSGTTLTVATGHGRDAIGIDIDHRNADLALDRVGPMFLEVDHPAEVVA